MRDSSVAKGEWIDARMKADCLMRGRTPRLWRQPGCRLVHQWAALESSPRVQGPASRSILTMSELSVLVGPMSKLALLVWDASGAERIVQWLG